MLAFTAGALAAKTVLPMAARAEVLGTVPETVVYPDADLVTALGEFDALERQINGLYYGAAKIDDDDDRDEAIDPISKAQHAPLERLCAIRARTLEGLQARARTIVLENLDLDPSVDAIEACCTNDRMMAALLRDLLAMGDA